MLVLCLIHAANAVVSMDLATQSVVETVASVDVCLSVAGILTFECPLDVAFSTSSGGGTYVCIVCRALLHNYVHFVPVCMVCDYFHQLLGVKTSLYLPPQL